MVGYQWVHLETYSRKPDKAGRSVGFVLDEARRDPAASQHIDAPSAPILVFGAAAEEVQALHDARVAEATTTAAGKARKVRQDQHTLATVVASFPRPWEEVRGDQVAAAELEHWQGLTVEWLRSQYGDQLVSVLRHDDEAHPHLHAYVLPAGAEMRAKVLHPGWAAKDEAKRHAAGEGLDAKAANAAGDAAYKAAMRSWQDSYWDAVGVPCGLVRLGPGRRRLTRAEWRGEQAAAKTAAELVAKATEAKAALGEVDAGVRVRLQTASNRELRAEAAAARAREAIAEAKAAAEAAKAAQDEAAERVRQAEAEGRRKARALLGQAQAQARQVVAAAEARAAPLRRLGGVLGGLWTGFRSVGERLEAAAEAKVTAARKAARAEVDQVKAEFRAEARAEVGSELEELRATAKRAEAARRAAEQRAAELEAKRQAAEEAARTAKAEAAAERRGRVQVERERETLRGRWAEADNALRVLERRNGPALSR